MNLAREIKKDIYWIGVNDRRTHIFENYWPLPKGVAYNSYIIVDEKVVVIDTIERSKMDDYVENIEQLLNGRKVDYLVINHMEPDHTGAIKALLCHYPDVKIIGNAKTFPMLKNFYGVCENLMEVKEGDSLDLGKHKLNFYMAPMLHWPETMVTFESTEGILFSGDIFGAFGTLDGGIFDDEVDLDYLEEEISRYYSNIVGKYGGPVQTTLKKAAGLDISIICPLHGPIWRSNLGYILDKYNTWSSYEPEEKAVMIAYASMYGNTENLANILAAKLAEAGIHNIAVYDVSNTHVSTLISEAFRCSHIVLAAPTYNGNVYPVMENFLNDMKALAVQKRTVAILDNGTWAATAGKQMADKIAEMKDMKIIGPKVSIKSSLKNEQLEQLDELVAEIKKDF
mgnify:CR=1 FL=1